MKWFLDLTMRGKLFISSGMMIAFLAAVIVTAYVGVTAIQDSQKSLYQKNFANAVDLLNIRSDENGMRAALLSMMSVTQRTDQETWHQDIKQRSKEIAEAVQALLERNRNNPQLSGKLEGFKTDWESFAQMRDTQIIPLIYAGKIEQAKALAFGIQDERHRKMRALAQKLGDEAVEQARAAVAASEQNASHVRLFVIVGLLATLLGVTLVRKHAETRVMRLNRVYAVLSGINTAIVRVRDRQALFAEACRIAVEHGGFRLAWIGLLDAEGAEVKPLAKADFDEGYLDQIRLTAGESEPDACMLVAQALREKTPVVCNDIESDMRMARWREEALRRGYRSVVVFPLLVGDKAVGLFALYASEKDFFDEEEMRLLVEMAGDISFAMDHLQKEARLDYLAYYDAVTGLPNRALFWDRVEQWIGASRHDRKVFSVIMLDLERFSTINETLGRQAGDELLRQLAQHLQESLDETGILARLSADCFGIAKRADDGADIAHPLEQMLSGIRGRIFVAGGKELRVAARAGVASFPVDGADIESLYRNAEAALKKAKLSKDEYQFYTPEINARVAETLTLENKLRRALEQEQFVLHYQPKVNLETGQISGLEALIRWNDPEAGLVPPLKFIPVLEETGMILQVGRWALEQAMADSGQWHAQGLLPPRIAVNVSPIQLRQKDFVGTVERVLSGAGNRAGGLDLEITESLIMQDIEANIRKLRAVREMGVEVAVDDFGTGYSSLSYLTRLPINALKIDRAFIINMASKPDDLSIVTTIISLGHSLNLKVIAEGVETEEQATLLRLFKCDEIQGYLFNPAVPAEQIEQFLREKKSLLTT